MALVSPRALSTLGATLAVLLVFAAGAWAILNTSSAPASFPAAKDLKINAQRGDVRITPDQTGAILIAKNMVPGQPRTGSILLTNTGRIPTRVRLTPYDISNPQGTASQTFRVKLQVGPKRRGLYSGPLGDFSKAKIANISPGRSVRVYLVGSIPKNVGNYFQDQSSQFSLRWTAAINRNLTPNECRQQRIRTRLFVFANRPVYRLVTRYQAKLNSRVRVNFFWRERYQGRWIKGARVAGMSSYFRKTRQDQWRWRRDFVRTSESQARKLRNAPNGFIATIRPSRTPPYCSRYLNIELTDLERRYGNGQYTWFQQGSFRYRATRQQEIADSGK